ncbi:L,D-transpeptidase [Limosilactobacillus sp. STM2_1]|uniref:L,D-transpeptidase n=1 Tax=Limosilactobacillus rudii TaxID=2759755 RepID=A0A7W3ULD8_9LACO|nr:L,D-transpeptidase [Limosilactobacillus rudii]MBB1079639.1 L,D-transpeptidase [Limosilactobacillus rudii]MBB1097717.1 L,D-transpeptidase [Limosilactobacillus rudii]MCD7134371.1 L,D-transpeptidase [Limosilactobacillus rudii]
MNLRVKHWIYGIFCLVIAIIAIGPELHAASNSDDKKAVVESQVKEESVKGKMSPSSEGHMRTPIDWHKSSETIPYPDLSKVKNFWVKVDLKKNRTYLYDGSKIIYTMYSTGGIYEKDSKTGKMKSATPTGTFYVQQERGDNFFNQSLKEGANYYVSWKNHGEYLFHSVPTKADGQYNEKEAAKLGKTQGSHGCIRLSIPDAQWMEHNLPVGTKVEIVG